MCYIFKYQSNKNWACCFFVVFLTPGIALSGSYETALCEGVTAVFFIMMNHINEEVRADLHGINIYDDK